MDDIRQISSAIGANISLGCGCCGCDSNGNGILPFLEDDSSNSGSITYTPATNAGIIQSDDTDTAQNSVFQSVTDLSGEEVSSNLNPTFEPGDTGIYGREFYTNEQIADQLNYGYWGGKGRAFDTSADNILTVNLNNLDDVGIATARQALQTWADLADIEFVEVQGTATSADIQFDDENAGAYNSSYGFIGTDINTLTESNINVDTAWTAYGTYYLQTYIHEIGHALGLGHAGNYNGSANVASDALYANDSWQASIMSYFSQGQNGNVDASTVRLLTPSMADIIAIQRLYGADLDTRAGDTIYGSGAEESYLGLNDSLGVTLYDAGGIDTIDLTHQNTSQGIDLQDGTFSNINGRVGNLGIAEGTIIENVKTGSGVDVIYGNSAENLIQTNAGNDQIYASAGNDILDGGADTDTLFYDGLFDTFSFAFTSAADFIVTSLSEAIESIDTVLNIEWLQFSDILKSTAVLFEEVGTETGNSSIEGDDTDNILTGTDEDDIIIGNGGADTLNGGVGDDVLHGDGFIVFEDFEGGAVGWSDNTTDTGELAGFSEFLGRFGGPTTGASTSKEFSLSGVQDTLQISFDVYQIDSWDNENFSVYINDVAIFDQQYSWGNARSDAVGTFDGGSFEREDILEGQNIGFRNYGGFDNDSITRYTLTLDDYTASTLKLGFGSDLDGGVSDESFGIDNLEIIATNAASAGNDILHGNDGDDTLFGGAGDDVLYGDDDNDSVEIITFEDFEGGAVGWSDNTTDTGELAGFSEFLGRFGGPTTGASTSKEFSLSSVQDTLQISFDVYQIDSWDNENFSVYINDVAIFDQQYSWGSARSDAAGTFDGGSFEREDILEGQNIGFRNYGGFDNDSITRYTLTLDDYTASTLKLGFGSDLDGGVSDESFGIDNLEIIATNAASAGNDILHGNDGDDTLFGGAGDDVLYGGEGADVFAFNGSVFTSGLGVIKDFDISENDAIDISQLLFGYDPLVDAISDFVQITDDGTDSFLAVDADGGADNFTQIAVVEGITGINDVAALELNGALKAEIV